MIIFCDMDGVVANIIDNWLTQYNKEWNDNLTSSCITGWDLKNFVKPECGSKIEDIIHKENFFLDATVYPGSQEYLKKIVDDGHDVFFATSSPIYMYPLIEKHLWIDKYFSFIGSRKVVCLKNKWLLRGNVLIDDYEFNLENFNGHKILLRQPWNENINDIKYKIANGWENVYNIIKRIERENNNELG